MSYRNQLSPWCIIRKLPKMQRLVIAQFRRRNDAEAHLRVLRQSAPTLAQDYEIVFDPIGEDYNPDPADTVTMLLANR